MRQAIPAAAPPPPLPTAPRTVCWLLLQEDAKRSAREPADITERLRTNPLLAQATPIVQAFFALLHERRLDDLQEWLCQATTRGSAELAAVAEGVRRDLAAVQAAMKRRWSQGQTAGQVNRLQRLTRQMYGRAKLDLLRQRVGYRAAP